MIERLCGFDLRDRVLQIGLWPRKDTMYNSLSQFLSAPRIERVRHEIKRRVLTVAGSEDVTPNMKRITLTGDSLADFVSLAPDDHLKVFIPAGGETEERRDYTPRRYDNAARTLVIDFAVHEAGPATQWAIDARVGDELVIGGPRGSAVVSAGVRQWLLIGDETALPAIGRRIEESDSETRITVIAAVADLSEEQRFETDARVTCHWVHRPLSEATDPTKVLEQLRQVDIEPETFVWIAAEASVVRALRAHLVEGGFPLPWLKASGYWVQGKADTTEKFD